MGRKLGHELLALSLDRLLDRGRADVEVDVLPAEAERFAALCVDPMVAATLYIALSRSPLAARPVISNCVRYGRRAVGHV